MFYREDWKEVREEHKAFWKLGNKKPLVVVTAPREVPLKDIEPFPVPPEIAELNINIDNCWYPRALNPAFAANRAEIDISKTYYGGVAFPYQLVSFGPDMPAAYLGVEPEFKEDTTWFRKPVIDDWNNLPGFRYDTGNKWWKMTEKLAEVLGENGKGKFLVGICDTLSGLDTLVSLRGANELLLDLVDHPEEVKKLTDEVTRLEIQWHEEIHRITQQFQEGSVSWLGVWSEGRTYPVQCDFAHMLSPKMFEEFALPFVKEFCKYLDGSIYHLDGRGQIAHLDILLDVEELNGIQWSVPVLSVDPPHDSEVWYPYFRRIQKAGKALHISTRPGSVKRLISDLSPEGLFLSVPCNSEKEAKELLEDIHGQ